MIEPLESRTLLALNTITITGTNSIDVVSISVGTASDGKVILKVLLNNVESRFDTTGTTKFVLNTLDGSDQCQIAEQVTFPFTVNLGGGDDFLNSGSGNDTIQGAGGADLIYGNDGNDLISGNDGGDNINGGDG